MPTVPEAPELQPLTGEEEAQPYAKYYARQPAPPNPKLMEILARGPMDPAKALPFEQVNDLLDPDYHDVETGYCLLEDGTGYVAVNNVFPGCTVEMLEWWFAWHAAGDGLRYKVWFPPAHLGISVSEGDRDRLLDPAVALAEKPWGTTHHVVENVGIGVEDIEIHFLDPVAFGLDVDRLAASPVRAVFGGFGFQQVRGTPIKGASVMLHTCRETDEGAEFRTRFWMGSRLESGALVRMLPPDMSLPIEAPMGLAFHNVAEYSNLASFLPGFHAEFGPDVW